MNKQFMSSSGAPLSYLISLASLTVAIANVAEYTTWRGGQKNLAYMIAGFGFAVFFAVIAGTLTIVAYSSGVDPFSGIRPLTGEADAVSGQRAQAEEMTVGCSTCGVTNIKRRSSCHKCNAPLGGTA